MIKHLAEISSFTAGDNTILKEVVHAKNDKIDLPYSLAYAFLPINEKSLPHTLLKSEELYYFLKGKGEIHIEGQITEVEEGSIVLVPKGAKQHVINTGTIKLEFLCIVSPPWKEEEEEV